MKRRFSFGEVWFYVAESNCDWSKLYILKSENVKKCIRMGITV